MRNWAISLTAIALAVVVAASQQEPPRPSSNCRATGDLRRVSDLPEGSGVAASRRTQGIFWAHNDSDGAVLLALDQHGALRARVRVTGAAVDDWEDIAVGACPQGSCIYIGDIGDNDGERRHITIYRTAEPLPTDAQTARVETLHATYPEGPQDAESLFVTPEGHIFIVTKGDPGAVALYRLRPQVENGQTAQLERVGSPWMGQNIDDQNRPTAADMSPDGRWIAVRTTKWVAFFASADLLAGRWREAVRADLDFVGEARGEGITFAGSDDLVLVGEGGALKGAGTFARITCALAPQ